MKVLVTGGAGFIGSNLIHHLIRNTPYDVVNVDKLTYAGNLDSLSEISTDPRYSFEKTDICDRPALEQLFARHNPAAVLHLAAESHVDRSIDGPDDFIQTNLVGTFQLLQTALRHYQSLPQDAQDKFRFIHVSTDEVFGSLKPDDPAFNESTPYDPHSPYSASKAGSDHLVRAWGDTYRLPVIITNCSNNYGPHQFPEKLIPVVILNALRGEPIPVYGQGVNVRDWLYVEDHCRALLAALEKGELGQTYTIGGNNELRNIDLVHTLCALLDDLHPKADGTSYADQITFVTDRPGHDLRYAIDSSKIQNNLGWSPTETVTTGLKKTAAWYLEKWLNAPEKNAPVPRSA